VRVACVVVLAVGLPSVLGCRGFDPTCRSLLQHGAAFDRVSVFAGPYRVRSDLLEGYGGVDAGRNFAANGGVRLLGAFVPLGLGVSAVCVGVSACLVVRAGVLGSSSIVLVGPCLVPGRVVCRHEGRLASPSGGRAAAAVPPASRMSPTPPTIPYPASCTAAGEERASRTNCR
jgi:hypothetical protein